MSKTVSIREAVMRGCDNCGGDRAHRTQWLTNWHRRPLQYRVRIRWCMGCGRPNYTAAVKIEKEASDEHT